MRSDPVGQLRRFEAFVGLPPASYYHLETNVLPAQARVASKARVAGGSRRVASNATRQTSKSSASASARSGYRDGVSERLRSDGRRLGEREFRSARRRHFLSLERSLRRSLTRFFEPFNKRLAQTYGVTFT
mmetsp:Transcript_27510/g.77082  ORF Transcript_27510/g.77082 Transcript_27510/m.77082 type:complete len:131 (-) Transcript_27510:537-929(-)